MKLSKRSIGLRTFTRAGIAAAFLLFVGGPLAALLVLPLVLVVAAYEYLYWGSYEFYFEDDDLKIESGVITKNSLDIPVRRIQDIDTSQSVLARVFGVVRVDVKTAGGDTSQASLRYLEGSQARDVEQQLRALQGRRETTGDDRPRQPETFYDIGDALVTYSLVRSVPAAVGLGALAAVIGIGVAGFLAATSLEMAGFAALAVGGAALLAALTFLTSFVGAYLQYYGFRVERRDGIFEYERGLVSRQGGSIPTEKIQHVEVTESFLMRYLGYATLKVETAGYAGTAETGTTSTTVLIPFERAETVYQRAQQLGEFEADPVEIDGLTDIGPAARRRYRRRYIVLSAVLLVACVGLVVAGFHPGLFVVPFVGFVLARPAARLKWSNIGFRRGERNLVVTRGFWVRRTYLVAHFRIQNLLVSRSLFQRRWGVATVTVDTAGRRAANPAVPDLEHEAAVRLQSALFAAFTGSVYATGDDNRATDDIPAGQPDPDDHSAGGS